LDSEAIGLYTAHGKIAFCGIQIRNGISLHGISLNVRNDLSLFQQIVACGVQNAPLDRLQNYDVNLTLEELFNRWIQLFRQEFQ
jgi:lipoyl(octanoyl) transferase